MQIEKSTSKKVRGILSGNPIHVSFGKMGRMDNGNISQPLSADALEKLLQLGKCEHNSAGCIGNV